MIFKQLSHKTEWTWPIISWNNNVREFHGSRVHYGEKFVSDFVCELLIPVNRALDNIVTRSVVTNTQTKVFKFFPNTSGFFSI
jgi:hypothetical protein